MKAVILAGGYGTRLAEETDRIPKPMVEIGGRPIIWHIMKLYAHYGVEEFVIALGYKGESIKHFFLDYHYLCGDITVSLASRDVMRHNKPAEDWRIHLVDTGLDTLTGGRLKRLVPWIAGETFLMTYGDGLSDVNVEKLLAFHRSQGGLATMTAVRPPARYGHMEFEGARVDRFFEKPQAQEGWINGGFFVLEPGVLDYIEGDETSFETTPLEALTRDRQMFAYRHEGFWQCMDTLRDVRLLRALWDGGRAPWKVWNE